MVDIYVKISHIYTTLLHCCLCIDCDLSFNIFILNILHHSILQVIFILIVLEWWIVLISYMYTCIGNLQNLLKAEKHTKFNQFKFPCACFMLIALPKGMCQRSISMDYVYTCISKLSSFILYWVATFAVSAFRKLNSIY